ncbi:uncharacterized protein LOC119288232 [Triticum dicoccoides]|uniref:uncharacterized protein LOC119288232 n=1 Tax=Triticum dicoccoides TaxID=85692 RepID=UPI00188EB4F2|nr:uncharacterized protein LOC119288232 [Triticum dicoccoides]
MEAGPEKVRSLERDTKSRLDSHPGSTVRTAGLFTDDLILEILSRLPARSVHRFKCVSVPWRDLIADPANRNKLPQTLAGFLYTIISNNACRHHFAGVSGDGAAPFDPSLPYLQPNKDESITQANACNGLLLYSGYKKNNVDPWTEGDFHFMVCNPATGRWVELPPQPQPQEPANRYSRTAGVTIYSSRTGAWSHRDSVIPEKVDLFFSSKCVFVAGTMYLEGINNESVLVGVDMQGKVWKTIYMPCGRRFGTIGASQGCLHYAIASVDDNNKVLVSEIELWCLKDRDSKQLVLKHTANIDKLMSMTGQKHRVVSIHPDCDTIFLVSCGDGTLVSYDMRHQKVGRILNLEKENAQRFLPYVPLLSESLSVADADE